jgi:hypothetical protein
MDTNQPNDQQINNQFQQQFGGTGGPTQVKLPNSVGALVLGIISAVYGLVWCYYIGSVIAIVCGIIAIVLSKNAKKVYDANPSLYTQSSFNNNKAGKILGIVGLCLASIWFVILIIAIVFVGTAASLTHF